LAEAESERPAGWLQPLTERRASWLELFVDLVFVVSVAQLSHALVDDPTAAGFLEFAATFVPIWWAWVGFTFFADRFESDDGIYRVVMLAGMLAVGVLAVNVPDAFAGGSTAFALSYVAVRAVLVALYVRARSRFPQARPLIHLYMGAFTASIVVWVISVLVPAPARYALWAVALGIDLGVPLAYGPRVIPRAPIHASHIPERFGLFTLIVFGETVLAVVTGTAETDWELHSVVTAAAGFVVVAALWWVYFDYLDTSILQRSVRAGQLYVYGHLPLLAALTAVGAGTALAIEEAGEPELGPGARWAFCGGVAVSVLAMAAIHVGSVHSLRDRDVWLRIAAAAAALVLAGLGTSALVVLPLCAAMLVALVAIEVAGHERHATAGAAGNPD
jgi:low temperature requirement protein LtrA